MQSSQAPSPDVTRSGRFRVPAADVNENEDTNASEASYIPFFWIRVGY